MLTSSEWLILMWRAPVYVRHTSLPDPKPQSSYFAEKGSRCDFFVWSSFRICKDLGGGRGGGESSLLLLFTQPCFPAPALSSSSSIWKCVSLFSPSSHLIVVLLERLVMIILSDGSVKSRFLIRVWRYPYWNEIAGNRGVKMVVVGGGCGDDGGIFTSTISW